MRRILSTIIWPVALALAGLAEGAFADEPGPTAPSEFEASFAAIVIRNCVVCHNPSDAKGALDLTSQSAAAKGGESGAVMIPGKPDESLLIERVTEGSMPPKGKGTRLTKDEVMALAAWVRAGAEWPAGRKLSAFELTTGHRAGYDWWSLQPVKRPAGPATQDDPARKAIDASVLGRVMGRGPPSPP